MQIELADIDFPLPEEGLDQEQLQGLTDSMKEFGLSHPIILRRANNLGKYQLVSGEKRLLAAQKLGWTEIKAEVIETSEREGRMLRLNENLKRFNLPWWEQVLLVEELHTIRQEEHGAATRGRPKENAKVETRGWSIRDTADELDMGIGPLSEDLTLARALRNDQSLKNVKDKKTAIRLVRIAAQRIQSETEAGINRFEGNQVFFGDSASILKKLPENSINHCITDPPWIKFFDPNLRMDERTLPVFKELYRVLKHGALVYIFCGLDDYNYYVGVTTPNPANPNESIHQLGELERIGFSVSSTPLLWRKENALSRRGVRPWEYDRDFEFIIVAAKGNPTLTSPTKVSGVKTFPIVHPSHMIHPHEKPVALIQDILVDCSYENQVIVDPFAGSGVLGEACKSMKRSYVLIERDKKNYTGICKRLKIQE